MAHCRNDRCKHPVLHIHAFYALARSRPLPPPATHQKQPPPRVATSILEELPAAALTPLALFSFTARRLTSGRVAWGTAAGSAGLAPRGVAGARCTQQAGKGKHTQQLQVRHGSWPGENIKRVRWS